MTKAREERNIQQVVPKELEMGINILLKQANKYW